MRVEVTTYHLEMRSPSELRPAAPGPKGLAIVRAEIPSPELARFLYTAVGGDWYWVDRLPWTRDEWLAFLDRPCLEMWVACLSGTPVGYYQLEKQAEGNVELVCFGLLPAFTGRGLGGVLLTRAVERGWQMGAARVWVHTCSLDHPRALANYRARGFRQFREETSWKDLPDEPPGPWPGARRARA